MLTTLLFLTALGATKPAKPPAPKPVAHPGVVQFAKELAREARADNPELTEAAIQGILKKAVYQQAIIDAISRPAEGKAWKDYRPIFMTEARIAGGVAFYRSERAALESLAAKYGVPPEIMVAIVGVETNYGRNTGKYRALDALATLAFHYPPRAPFFRSELKQLLKLPGEGFPFPLEQLTGSYAGAMGMGQFMPTSIAKYALDGDGDGKLDLWQSRSDVLASIANYLVGYGWVRDQPIAAPARLAEGATPVEASALPPERKLAELASLGIEPVTARAPDTAANLLGLDAQEGREYWLTYGNFYVLSRYNRSPLYCLAVHQLALAIAAEVAKDAPPATAP